MFRRGYDNYKTPPWVVDALIHNHLMPLGRVLEPCAGDGVILKTLSQHFRTENTAVEIRPEEKENLLAVADHVYITDFLTWEPPEEYDLIITNPPYSIAQEVIERCLAIAGPDTDVIMLLRLSFLESRKRRSFWREHPASYVYVLSERPSFTGKGTDSSAYAWFVWQGKPLMQVSIISREE